MQSEKYGVGTLHKNKKGEEFEIIEKLSGGKRIVKLLSTGVVKECWVSAVSTGTVYSEPIKNKSTRFAIGTKHITSHGETVEVISINKNKVVIRFMSDSSILEVDKSQLARGQVKSLNVPSVYGVGFLGSGDHMKNHIVKNKLALRYWHSMFDRCYGKNNKQNTYKNVTVCEEWHCFGNFSMWFDNNYPYIVKDVKFALDKDLLQQNVENKIYSPKTCIFLPISVNGFIINRRSDRELPLGVSFEKLNSKYKAQIMDFTSRKKILIGFYSNPIEAEKVYNLERCNQIESVKSYLKNLNYLPEEIIELVK